MSPQAPLYAFGPFVLDPSRRQLRRGEEEVPLTPKSFDVLRALVEGRGELVSKEVLLETVWPGTVVEESNLTFQISTLRKALREKNDGIRYIATVPGRGYQLVAPVESIAADMELILEERSRTTFEIEESDSMPSRKAWAIGVAAAVLVLAIALSVTLVSVRGRPARPPDAGAGRSLAVLPFKPIVESDRDEALELGMADALIARISTIDGLIVRPLTSVRRYGDAEADPIAAGKALGVDTVLDGSIHRAGDQIRVTARLLRVSDSKQLWQENFDDRFSGIFGVQDSISRRIAAALALTLTPQNEVRLASHRTSNMEAYREYATGRLHLTRVRAGDVQRSIPHFERAVELDPRYADAWAGIASAWATLAISSDARPADTFVRARAAAEQALSLDPASADAWAAIGSIRFWYLWDWSGSEEAFRRALEIDPGYGFARLRLAHLLSNTGRHEESRMEALEAQRLEPLSPIVNAFSGQFHLQAGDVGSGTRLLLRALELEPDFWMARLNLGKAYEYQGRLDEALVEFRRALESSGPNTEALMMIGYVEARLGRTEEATRVLDRFLESARNGYFPPTRIALVYVGLDQPDEAFTWLERACVERDPGLVFLYANPRWRQLEQDPRFESIRQCVGLPEWP